MTRSSRYPRAPGRYKEFDVLEELGGDDAARVYKVRAPGHERPLALKLSLQTPLSTVVLKRAVREIAILRNLSGPHVARMVGSSIGEDHFYLLTELLEGAPLDEAHDMDEPMAVGEALKIVLQASLGLVEAHARGVVHRDIRPANLWLEPDATIRIADFGWARAWGVPWAYGANATESQTLIGTPHYCQPEQLLTDALTPASDVYSLTTVLYELLSGHNPLLEGRRVTQADAELGVAPTPWLEAHVTHPVAPITKYPGCAGLPDSVITLLAAGLAKDPSHRPANATEFAALVAEILVEELEAIVPAHMECWSPGGTASHHVLLPGRRRIGHDPDADIHLGDVDAQEPAHSEAMIDWSGFPRPIRIKAGEKTMLHYDGDRRTDWVVVEPGRPIIIGEATLLLQP